MAVTSKTMRSMRRTWNNNPAVPRGMQAIAYSVTLVLAALAAYVLISLLVTRVAVTVDDLRYGRPRTDHLEAFVGHDETAGLPTHLIALNLNRQIVIFEIPGGDTAKTRTINGPYLFGAEEHLTPAVLGLADVDGDGLPDLLLDIRRERIVYLNRDGTFRLPTAEEQAFISMRETQ
ncbi:MAG TPA: hypothetical protein PKA05_03740 [Roseiflexaceae bacterium]|nr:hypothetical protein [Roseiflexaceae bacterium]HMP39471.1 hypothetical protein [Roseiflexaceae bacterium]